MFEEKVLRFVWHFPFADFQAIFFPVNVYVAKIHKSLQSLQLLPIFVNTLCMQRSGFLKNVKGGFTALRILFIHAILSGSLTNRISLTKTSTHSWRKRQRIIIKIKQWRRRCIPNPCRRRKHEARKKYFCLYFNEFWLISNFFAPPNSHIYCRVYICIHTGVRYFPHIFVQDFKCVYASARTIFTFFLGYIMGLIFRWKICERRSPLFR